MRQVHQRLFSGPDEAAVHPRRNILTQSVGPKETVPVDLFDEKLDGDEWLLLCSDGLWDMVRDPQIANLLQHPVADLGKTGDALIDAALNGGGDDNVSVIVVYITEATQRTGITGVQLLARPEAPQWPPI